MADGGGGTRLFGLVGARDGLARARLLSGSPVLGRGKDVLPDADPLRLRGAGMAATARAQAAASDHAAPERQVFALPDMRPRADAPEEDALA